MNLLLLFACWCTSALAESSVYYSLEDAELHFNDFIKTFDKHYANENEKAARFEIFKTNLVDINQSNKESNYTVFGITQFSDLTTEEFIQKHTGLSTDLNDGVYCDKILQDQDIPNAGAPEAFDWRSSNIVSPVKNQESCGSCYSFSTTGHLESQYAIKYRQAVILSEQQIIDCDLTSHGCLGGYMSSAMKALIQLGGSMQESDYPYIDQQGQCRSDQNRVAVRLSSCYSYNLRSQETVKQLLYRVGPVAIAIQADSLQGYKSGIVADARCVGSVNHAVLLVGYGIENNIPYWIVKNSWGQNWAESGYFRLQRSDNPSGACGMLNTFMATAVIQ